MAPGRYRRLGQPLHNALRARRFRRNEAAPPRTHHCAGHAVRLRRAGRVMGAVLGRCAAILGAGGLLGGLALPVGAEDYPSKPIRILVPFVPGGATDILARLVGQGLTTAWGQQVVIDNRPGANGILAADMTAKATPDGHTLLFVAIGHAINPLLQKKLPYDTQKDFTPVSLAAVLPLIVCVHPSVPATSVKELIALAKSGKKLNYASGGVGSSQHLATALFASMAKIDIVHIPY